MTDLRYEDESHREEATKDDGCCNESETGIRLGRDDEADGRGNQAEHHDVVDGHADVAGIVDATGWWP